MSDYSKTILEEMNISPAFAEWSIDLVKDGLSRKILEIGCGLGRNLIYLQKISDDLIATDYNQEYLDQIKLDMEFMNSKLLRWDLSESFNHKINSDSFFCSNVIEHIKDDAKAVFNISKIESIKKGVFIVPNISYLYNELDISLGHFRRYDHKTLETLLSENGFIVEKIFSFNKIGVLGWFLQGSIIKNKTLGTTNMKIYNSVFPVVTILDKYLPFCGLSIAAIVKKK